MGLILLHQTKDCFMYAEFWLTLLSRGICNLLSDAGTAGTRSKA